MASEERIAISEENLNAEIQDFVVACCRSFGPQPLPSAGPGSSMS